MRGKAGFFVALPVRHAKETGTPSNGNRLTSTVLLADWTCGMEAF